MQITNILVFAVESIVLILLGQYILNINTKNFDDDAAVKAGNKAIPIRRFGGFLGLTLAIAASYIGSYSGNLLQDATEIALYGLVGIGSIVLGIFKSDILLSPGFQNNAAIKAGNKAVAIFEAYVITAVGVITFAAWAHDGSFIGGLVYYVIGLAIFYTIGLFYRNNSEAELIEVDADEFSAHRKGTILLGYAIILWANIYGPLVENTSLSQSLMTFIATISVSIFAFMIGGLTIGSYLFGSKYSKYEPYLITIGAMTIAVLVRLY